MIPSEVTKTKSICENSLFFFFMIKSWKIVTGGIPLFKNCNIKNNSEFVPLLNDVTELISSLSLFLRFDLMMDDIMKNPIIIDIITKNFVVVSTTAKYNKLF